MTKFIAGAKGITIESGEWVTHQKARHTTTGFLATVYDRQGKGSGTFSSRSALVFASERIYFLSGIRWRQWWRCSKL